MTTAIRVRRDAAATWTSANPVLELGEPGLEVDTLRMKFGNGYTQWSSLPYYTGGFNADWNAVGGATAILNKPTIPSLNNAALTGAPTAATAAPGTNNTQLATTAYADTAVAVEATRAGAAEALLAPIASPTFTGTPAAPTATTGTNSTQIATTAYVMAAVANLIASAPGALDTLNELATALGNDANFASTVTAALSAKAPLASPTLTGTPAAPTAALNTNTTQIATTAFALAQAALHLPLSGGTLTGAVAGPAFQATASTINAQAGTTYSLDASDNGKVVTLNNASAITVTVPAGLGAGFSCLLVQIGAGQVGVTASGTTINSSGSKTHLAEQYAAASLFAYSANTFVLAGNIA